MLHIKTILLAPLPPPAGGIAAWTVRMLNAKLKDQWSVSVVDEKVLGGREIFGGNCKKNIFTEIKRSFNIWKDLFLSLQDSDSKVVHSCIPSAPMSMIREYVCAVITKLNRRKFVVHFRCTIPNVTHGTIGVFILKRLCNISNLIMVLNKQSADFLKGKTSTRIATIPNFVETCELNEKRMINRSVKNVLYIGGVIEEKGILEMLEVAADYPDICFRFVGNTDEKLEQLAKERSLSNTFFTGSVDRDIIKSELNLADIFMFLSYFPGEGFSNALAEAMAAGIPCIATDWAANCDMIENKGGIVVPIKDSAAASVALRDMQSYDLRCEQSHFNLEKVKNYYLDKIVLDCYVEEWNNLVKP